MCNFLYCQENVSDKWTRTEERLRPPPPRARTPPTTVLAVAGPSKARTPEPDEGELFIISPQTFGLNACTSEHWLLHDRLWHRIQEGQILFHVHGIRGSEGGKLDKYEGKPARTVPNKRRESPLPAADGEVIVHVPKVIVPGNKEISINPRFLVPWPPTEGSVVVVVDVYHECFSFTGTVLRKDGDIFIVEYGCDGLTAEKGFTGDQLAVYVPL